MIRIEVTTTTTYELDEAFIWPEGASIRTAAAARDELLSDMNGISVAGWLCEEIIDASWPVLKVDARKVTAVEIDVPNPAYAGDDVLFGDPPPQTIADRATIGGGA